jgi:hypothetical protein
MDILLIECPRDLYNTCWFIFRGVRGTGDYRVDPGSRRGLITLDLAGHESHLGSRRELPIVRLEGGGAMAPRAPWISQMWRWQRSASQSRTLWKDTSPSFVTHPTCSRERKRVRVLSSALRYRPTVAPYALPGSVRSALRTTRIRA